MSRRWSLCCWFLYQSFTRWNKIWISHDVINLHFPRRCCLWNDDCISWRVKHYIM